MASLPGRFLPASEREDYDKPGRRVARSLVEAPIDRLDAKPKSPMPLDRSAVARLKTLVDHDQPTLDCLCVQVSTGDGMTWSAEIVNDGIAETHPHLHRWCFAANLTPDRLPVIAMFIGVKAFLRLAVAHGLTTAFLSLRTWVTPLILLCAIGAGVVAKLADTLIRVRSGPQPGVLTMLVDPWLYAIAALAAGGGLLGQYITTMLTTKTQSKSTATFLEDLEGKQATVPYADFVESLAARLRSVSFPRCVIIDNYERLDRTTRLVLERYLETHSRSAGGSELWIVFEPADGSQLSSRVAAEPRAYGSERFRTFRQLLLDNAEKRTLATLIGRPERAVFATVKQVSSGDSQGTRWIRERLLDHRLRHPHQEDRYGDLEFLFFLSLTTVIGPTPLTQRFLINHLSVKSGLRFNVLPRILHGTTTTKDEYQLRLRALATVFPSLVIVDEQGDAGTVQVTPEAGELLTAMADELQLPSPGIGHLFWSLFWYDRLQNEPREAFWTRKLAQHLLSADPSALPEADVRMAVSARLFDALLFSVDASLQSCLFADVLSLLEKAAALEPAADGTVEPQNQRRFLRECWKAYSLMGHERILGLIMDVEPGTWGFLEATADPSANLLQGLFFDVVPVLPATRAILASAATRPSGAVSEALESAVDHARARAIWMAFAIAPFVHRAASLDTARAIIEGNDALDHLVKTTYRRLLGASETSIRVTDVLTLSLALWCQALTQSPGVVEVRVQHGSEALADEIMAAIQLGGRLDMEFESFLEQAQDVVALAGDLRKESARDLGSPRGMDFILNGLARELGTVSVAAVVIASRYRQRSGRHLADSSLARINDIVRAAGELLDRALSQIAAPKDVASDELRRNIDEMLDACRIVWKRFDLDRLHALLDIRRVHFDLVSAGPALEEPARYLPLLASLDAAPTELDFGALMGNLVIAGGVTRSAEIAAHYFCRAATIADAGHFGERLKNELAYLSLLTSPRHPGDIERFMRRVLSPAPGHAPFATTVLGRLRGRDLCDNVRRLFNARRLLQDPELRAKLLDIVDTVARTVEDPSPKQEIQSLTELQRLEDRLGRGEPLDVGQLLTAWDDRQTIWLYPTLLDLLLTHGYSSAELVQRGLALLERDAALDSYNSYLHLASTIARSSAEEEEEDDKARAAPAILYIKNSVDRWEPLSSVEMNLDMFRILSRFVRDGGGKYYAGILKWEAIKVERDHQRRLPDLIQQGRFFLVFEDYCRSMMFWGLATDLSPKEYLSHGDVEPSHRAGRAREWKTHDAAVPSPLLHGGATVVSARFLHVGHDLFSPPIAQDAAFDEDRRRFDEVARARLAELLELIVALPKLPESLRHLLQMHSGRLLESTPPKV